jgi:hypothetical protein
VGSLLLKLWSDESRHQRRRSLSQIAARMHGDPERSVAMSKDLRLVFPEKGRNSQIFKRQLHKHQTASL